MTCLLCGETLKTSGNTTNLKNHLKSIHPKVLNDKQSQEPGQNRPSTSTNTVSDMKKDNDNSETEEISDSETCSNVSTNTNTSSISTIQNKF